MPEKIGQASPASKPPRGSGRWAPGAAHGHPFEIILEGYARRSFLPPILLAAQIALGVAAAFWPVFESFTPTYVRQRRSVTQGCVMYDREFMVPAPGADSAFVASVFVSSPLHLLLAVFSILAPFYGSGLHLALRWVDSRHPASYEDTPLDLAALSPLAAQRLRPPVVPMLAILASIIPQYRPDSGLRLAQLVALGLLPLLICAGGYRAALLQFRLGLLLFFGSARSRWRYLYFCISTALLTLVLLAICAQIVAQFYFLHPETNYLPFKLALVCGLQALFLWLLLVGTDRLLEQSGEQRARECLARRRVSA